tara:strand:+ start:112 stop:222 length:111 start_codon:yes stop_codon:yes gene_type:complete
MDEEKPSEIPAYAALFGFNFGSVYFSHLNLKKVTGR